MFSKVIVVFVAVCAVSLVSGDVSSVYPRFGGAHPNSIDFDSNPQYSFSYSVNDAHTGDNHAQEETRNGDNVHGSYSLVEADGTLRTVKYTADAANGFQAVVEHSGGASRSFGAPAARIVPLPAYTPSIPKVAAAIPISVPSPQIYRGSGNTHTSFSAPHASYQY